MPSSSRAVPHLQITTTTGAPLDRLRYGNADAARSPRFGYTPDRLVVTVELPPELKSAAPGSIARLHLPPAWLALPSTARVVDAAETQLRWTVYPRERPEDFTVSLGVELHRGRQLLGRADLTLPVTVEGYSQFDPAHHALPFANRVDDLGVITPQADLFARTYRGLLFPRAFFHGLYRAIVFLGGREEGYLGGICTGMARAALARSLGQVPENVSLRDLAIILHGRQLTDRALLASVPWFFAPSPQRAFQRFQDEILTQGWSDRCFDVGVPRPWRRDIHRALMSEGHTVVPYGFRQSSPTQAEVLVWDPNHPSGPEAGASVLTVDLQGNTYGYRGHSQLGDRSTTLIAVRQRAYWQGRTALLASLANLLLFPRTIRQSRRYLLGGGATLGAGLIATVAALVHYRRKGARHGAGPEARTV